MKNANHFLILALVGAFAHVQLFAQSFAKTADDLEPVFSGRIKWVDTDKDGDLDLFYCGSSASGRAFYIYENTNGSYVERSHSLPGLADGSFAFGDYDGDDDLDILLTGTTATGNIASLFENQGAWTFVVRESFPGMSSSSAFWIDFDNDLDLDLVLTGNDESGGTPQARTMLYENNSGIFEVLSSSGLPDCHTCVMEWADFNNDGWPDVVVSGTYQDGSSKSLLYLNSGDITFHIDNSIKLKNLALGDVKSGDFDLDGDLDLIQCGTEQSTRKTVLFENMNGKWRTRTEVVLPGVGQNHFGGILVVDYNLDDFPDLVLSGSAEDGSAMLRFFKNDGYGSFQEDLVLPGLENSALDFADFDNDGDTDIAYMGTVGGNAAAGILGNTALVASYSSNTPPGAPDLTSALERSFFRNQFYLLWDYGTDAETNPGGLRYNLYLRTDDATIISPPSNTLTGGTRSTVNPNAFFRSAFIKSSHEGNHYWSVQTVDAGGARSPFSSERQFFKINGPQAIKAQIVDATQVKLFWSDNSLIETGYRVERSLSPLDDFTEAGSMSANASEFADIHAFGVETEYHYRIMAVSDAHSSGYDSLTVVIPATPGNLSATASSATRISLRWADLSSYETGYVVERKASADVAFTVIANLPAGRTSFNNSGLQEGNYYEYRVRAITPYGGSTYSLIVSAVTNFRPTINDFDAFLEEDGSLNFTAGLISQNFNDSNGDALHAVRVESVPDLGILQLNGAGVQPGDVISAANIGQLMFTPDADQNGVVSFQLRASDGKDFSSAAATVQLIISPVNDPPVFYFSESIELDEDFTDLTSFAPYPGSPENELFQGMTYSIEPATSDLVNLTLDPLTGSLEITPVPHASGSATFVLIADDGMYENNYYSQEFTITVYPINDAPAIAPLEDVVISKHDVPADILLDISDPDNTLPSLVLAITSSNEEVVASNNIEILGSEEVFSLRFAGDFLNVGETTVTLSASDGEFTSQRSFTLTIAPVTGVVESAAEEFKIAPNPVKDLLIFSNEISGSADVTTMAGAVVKTILIARGSSADVSTLPPGFYLVKLFAGKKILFGKFVKE